MERGAGAAGEKRQLFKASFLPRGSENCASRRKAACRCVSRTGQSELRSGAGASEPWSGRRGCQVLPPADDEAVFLAESLRPWVATVRVAGTVAGLESGSGEDLLVAPTIALVPASTGFLQQRKLSVLQGRTRMQSATAWVSAFPSPALTCTLIS